MSDIPTKFVLFEKRAYDVGMYESDIIRAPNPVTWEGVIKPFRGDKRKVAIEALRDPSWPAGDNCIEVQVWVNYHPDKLKWNFLIGFEARGSEIEGTTGTSGKSPVSRVFRKLKPERIRQLKVIVNILRPITTEISMEFL